MWSRFANLFARSRSSAPSSNADDDARVSGELAPVLPEPKPAQRHQAISSSAAQVDLHDSLSDSEGESETPTSIHSTPLQPETQTPAVADELPEQISARWAAARNRPLLYAHKVRLEPLRAEEQATQNAGQLPKDDERAALVSSSEPPDQAGVEGQRAIESTVPETVSHQELAPHVNLAKEEPNQSLRVSSAQGRPEKDRRRFAMLHTVARQWRPTVIVCKYFLVVGSPGEGRKLAPVIRTLRAQHGSAEEVLVCIAGQRTDRTRAALHLLDVAVDMELSVAEEKADLEETRTRMISGFGKIFVDLKPRWLIVQGDGITAAMASIAAYYANVPVAHVDGGMPLHEHHADESEPQVLHRLIASLFASMHFTDTSLSKESLLREGVPEECILVTGNTGIDAMQETCALLGLPLGSASVRSSGVIHVLVIAEMPETVAKGLSDICLAIRNLAMSVPGLYQFVWPVQADDRGVKLVGELLDRVPGMLLSGPANYEQFLRYLSECDLVLTDVEDVQEDAPSLGKPVLLMRQSTERPEALRAGITTLTKTDAASIQAGIRSLARKLSVRHGSITNPYGDGKAAMRILDFFQGRQVREFGRTALPRMLTSSEPSAARLTAGSAST